MSYVLTNYTVQCTDETSRQKGCFLFDLDHYAETGKFKAIGPVFPDLYAFYQGTTPDERKSCCIEHTN